MDRISPDLEKNRQWVEETFQNCDDILHRQVFLNNGKDEGILVYVEVAVSNLMLEEHVIGLSDVQPLTTYEEGEAALLAGNGILFVQGDTCLYKISSKGYPGIGVSPAESEKVMRGSREGFTESEKINVALIRKRIRDVRMKVEEQRIGVRSHTMTALVYMEDLIEPQILRMIKDRMEQYEIDGIMDSGMLEQLLEEHWMSPFPQFQTTERPDLAAMEVLDGRVVLLCDNSPVALLLPSVFQDFMNVTEDRYNRFEIASFERVIRYAAMIFSFLLSGTYLAVIGFHTMILPTNLILSFAESRQGVPFPSLLEVLFMELAFELIREAGIRMPGALSGTIGIVGGLIIGDAAVSANLVSPMAVVIVALSALSSFAIPNEECTSAFRLIKYGFILLGGLLGMYGIVLGLYLLLGHLARLTSFKIPYLMPFIGKDIAGYQDERDLLVRSPMRKMRYRPIYTRRFQRVRLRDK